MKENEIFKLLKEREKQSSTAITDFVAIPHIIIKGSNEFHILIARVKNGIEFSELQNNVKAVFVLIGTKENRNLHLRSLSAIAQVIQDKNFIRLWEKAKDERQLKDIIHLSKRFRQE